MTQIDGDFLLPPCPGLQLTSTQTEPQQLVLTVTSTNPVAFCPVCQTPRDMFIAITYAPLPIYAVWTYG